MSSHATVVETITVRSDSHSLVSLSPHCLQRTVCLAFSLGYKIYRTVYSTASVADFEKALEVLLAYMRYECFVDVFRSDNRDDSSDDMSLEERAYYENLEPNNALLTGEVENVDDGTDHRFRGGEGVRQKASGPQESNSGVNDGEGEVIDNRSNQQLWQRPKNDVEEDLSLEGCLLPSYK